MNMRMTQKQYFDIKKACNMVTGYSVWDLRALMDEVDELRSDLKWLRDEPSHEKRAAYIDIALEWKDE